jgi:hypothetical protein
LEPGLEAAVGRRRGVVGDIVVVERDAGDGGEVFDVVDGGLEGRIAGLLARDVKAWQAGVGELASVHGCISGAAEKLYLFVRISTSRRVEKKADQDNMYSSRVL